jgi:carbamoyltransferase
MSLDKIFGVKLTHDAGIAMIRGDELVFATELEKIDNRDRYGKAESMREIKTIISGNFKEKVGRYDKVIIDGWRGKKSLGGDYGQNLALKDYEHAPYCETDVTGLPIEHLHQRFNFKNYASYSHVAGHVIGSYVCSPFAKTKAPAAVLVWDGGISARIYYVDPNKYITAPGPNLIFLRGAIYGAMGYYFGPFAAKHIYESEFNISVFDPDKFRGQYEWPGKLMAYIAKGTQHKNIETTILELYLRMEKVFLNQHQSVSAQPSRSAAIDHEFMRAVYGRLSGEQPADVLLAIHNVLGRLLVSRLIAYTQEGLNLIFTGGSALNIKWNSMLRNCGHFNEVWVPPFPNDSGSAIGAAACEAALVNGVWSLRWDVYCGLNVNTDDAAFIFEKWYAKNWLSKKYSLEDLAYLLMENPDQPILFLNGKAEIGPRALGNRSILMSATQEKNRDILNEIKKRETYRPVAPICLEEYAEEYFDPGTPDPYMLFDHKVRPLYKMVVPAIVHLDGTARLQTVSISQNREIYELLSHYRKLTACSVLCNTSANYPGKGFFSDLHSALEWATNDTQKVNYVWCNGTLHYKINVGETVR